MKIRETRHFLDQLRGRGIGLDDVHNVLNNPLMTWPDPVNRSKVYVGRSVSGRMLYVCLVDPTPLDGVGIVKTTYWQST